MAARPDGGAGERSVPGGAGLYRPGPGGQRRQPAPSPAVGGEPQPGSPLLCVHPLLRRRHGSAFALPAGPSSPAHPRPGRRPALAGDRPVRGGLRRLLVHRAEDLL